MWVWWLKDEPYWRSSVCTQSQEWRGRRQGQGQPCSNICLYFLMFLLFLSILLHFPLKPQWYKMAIFQLDQFWTLIQCWNITVSSCTCLDTLIYRSGADVFAREISTFSCSVPFTGDYPFLPYPVKESVWILDSRWPKSVTLNQLINERSFHKPSWFWLR